jgi:Zn-dependent M32 family carboxypeptidase
MFNMITAMKKQVLIRGVDEDIYRRAKSAAALQGVSMGLAVSEALRGWVENGQKEDDVQKQVKQNVHYVKAHWSDLKRHKGEAVVISGKKLQGVFSSYEEARSFSSRFKVALTFVVDKMPQTRELELGPDLEVQHKIHS